MEAASFALICGDCCRNFGVTGCGSTLISSAGIPLSLQAGKAGAAGPVSAPHPAAKQETCHAHLQIFSACATLPAVAWSRLAICTHRMGG